MISRFTVVLIICFVATATAWVATPISRMEFFQKAIMVGAATFTAPYIANAVDLSGSYSDPFHPNCNRIITVDGSSVTLKGTDGNPGCPADGSGRAWVLDGTVKGNEIFVDFSPKGGPKDLKGVFDGSGINWPDGNKWSIKK